MVYEPAQGHWCSRRRPESIARRGPGTVGTDPSLVRHSQPVGYRRSRGNLASRVTRFVGECRMSLWSALVVSPPETQPPDLFRVRECYLPLMLSHLRPELVYLVHAHPPVSVTVSRHRYSVCYSPPGLPGRPLRFSAQQRPWQ